MENLGNGHNPSSFLVAWVIVTIEFNNLADVFSRCWIEALEWNVVLFLALSGPLKTSMAFFNRHQRLFGSSIKKVTRLAFAEPRLLLTRRQFRSLFRACD